MTIGIQKTGRLTGKSLEYLTSTGICGNLNDLDRHDYFVDGTTTVVQLKYGDILPAIVNSVVDFGIIGSDTLVEESEMSKGLGRTNLHFGNCRIVIVTDKASGAKNLVDLNNKIIATEFPNITTNYLKKIGIDANLYRIHGSAEVFPYLGYAQAIVTIAETGNSLKANGLSILDALLEVSAVLVYKEHAMLAENDFTRLIKSLNAK